MDNIRTFLIVLLLLIGTASVHAHEFWIAPETPVVEAGGDIIADILVGQNFSGDARPLLPFSYSRLDVVSGGSTEPVGGRMGDLPAVKATAPDTGLAIIVAVTKGASVTYKKMEDFETFLDSKGVSGILEDHRARRLPDAGFAEKYRRFAKALVAVGSGAGADRDLGLESEIVARANPYVDDVSDGLPVQVLFQGEALSNNQLDVFAKDSSGNVSYTSVRTDADGRAVVPVAPGSDYLLDTVVMAPAPKPQSTRDPVWLSYWASLTFKVPAAGQGGVQ